MDKEEIWKDIPGYEGLYQVSNLGRVYSLPKEWVTAKGTLICHKGKILKTGDTGSYLYLNLSINGNSKSYFIHQLVAMAFLGHKPSGYKLVVDHINNNSYDNRPINLQLTTSRYNSSKDKKNKTSKYTGVYWFKKSNKWKSQITLNGKQKYLGLFKCELSAHHAYQKALNEYNKR